MQTRVGGEFWVHESIRAGMVRSGIANGELAAIPGARSVCVNCLSVVGCGRCSCAKRGTAMSAAARNTRARTGCCLDSITPPLY